jgi:8-oxo-dGTP pyrophosphatase MutT (NUDIX family)
MSDLRSNHEEVRLGPGGIPDWLEPMVRFCSRCGGALSFGAIEGEERERLSCPSCGFIFYVNPQPGGFLEIDETVRDAAIRETLEETGLTVEPGDIVGLYSRLQAAVVVVAFEARIAGGAPTVTRESLETRPFAPDAIPWPEIAFETSRAALRDWVARVRPDLPLPDASAIHRPFGA